MQPTSTELVQYMMCWAGFHEQKRQCWFQSFQEKHRITVRCKSARKDTFSLRAGGFGKMSFRLMSKSSQKEEDGVARMHAPK